MGMLRNAHAGKAPVVVLAGQQSHWLLADEPYLHAARAAEFPQPYVKWADEPALAEAVPGARALRLASTPPRGPVVPSVPEDDSGDESRADLVRTYRSAPDPTAVAELAAALRAAARPALVVGADADSARAWDTLTVLAEALDTPAWRAPLAHRYGLPTGHRLFAGFLRPRPDALRTALPSHDLVLVVGAPAFAHHLAGTGGPPLPPDATLHLITDSPDAPVPVGATVVPGSPDIALIALRNELGLTAPGGPHDSPRPRRRTGCSMPSPTGPPADAVIVEEAPTHRDAIQEQIAIGAPSSYFTCGGGVLGWALPAAVGIALARPECKVVALLGDGATMYSVQALFTAVTAHAATARERGRRPRRGPPAR